MFGGGLFGDCLMLIDVMSLAIRAGNGDSRCEDRVHLRLL